MTSPVVTLGAEVANPWRARCPKRGTPGSEEGVVETTQTGTAPCPYPTSPGGNHLEEHQLLQRGSLGYLTPGSSSLVNHYGVLARQRDEYPLG